MNRNFSNARLEEMCRHMEREIDYHETLARENLNAVERMKESLAMTKSRLYIRKHKIKRDQVLCARDRACGDTDLVGLRNRILMQLEKKRKYTAIHDRLHLTEDILAFVWDRPTDALETHILNPE